MKIGGILSTGSFSDCVSPTDNTPSLRSPLTNVPIGGVLSTGLFSDCVSRTDNAPSLRSPLTNVATGGFSAWGLSQNVLVVLRMPPISELLFPTNKSMEWEIYKLWEKGGVSTWEHSFTDFACKSENSHQSQNTPYLLEAIHRSDVYNLRLGGDLSTGHSQTVLMLCW